MALTIVIFTSSVKTTKAGAVIMQEKESLSAYKAVEALKSVAELELQCENITSDNGVYIAESDNQTVTMSENNEIEVILKL